MAVRVIPAISIPLNSTNTEQNNLKAQGWSVLQSKH